MFPKPDSDNDSGSGSDSDSDFDNEECLFEDEMQHPPEYYWQRPRTSMYLSSDNRNIVLKLRRSC